MKNYYDVLGIEPTADETAIRRAWRKAARDSHPDLNPGEEARERFDLAAEAYATLSDPTKRRAYDMARSVRSAFVCPRCGSARLPGMDFCFRCSASATMSAEVRAAAEAAREAERAALHRAQQEAAAAIEKSKREAAAAAEKAKQARAERQRKKRRQENQEAQARQAGLAAAAQKLRQQRDMAQVVRLAQTVGDAPWVQGEPIQGHMESPEEILQQVLAASALDVRIRMGPKGELKIEGPTVDQMRHVQGRINRGLGILTAVKNWLS